MDTLLGEISWRKTLRGGSASIAGRDFFSATAEQQANAVFASLPRQALDKLLEKYFFYTWDEEKNEVRWMCSWNTSEMEVDNFAAAIHESCR